MTTLLLSVRRLAFVIALSLGCISLGAADQPTAPKSSDDPMAGLNLGNPVELTGFAGKFDHHLVSLNDGRLKKFDASALKNIKYWAFYYSASWCPPCRAFTPKLVEFYNQFKSTHPNFELIFVNHDQSEDAMLSYMKTDSMPWPAVQFDDIDRLKANQYCGEGIPDLVLVDSNGKVISDSFHGSDYVGPEQVIEDIKKLVPTP